MTTKERVHQIICDELGHEDAIADETTWDELGADSLDIVEILFALEENFSIDIPDDDAEDWKNVGQAVAYLEKLEDVT